MGSEMCIRDSIIGETFGLSRFENEEYSSCFASCLSSVCKYLCSSPIVRLVNHCFTTCTGRTSRLKAFTGRICSTVLDKDGEEERREDWEERGGAQSPLFAPATMANFGATLAILVPRAAILLASATDRELWSSGRFQLKGLFLSLIHI